MEVGVNDVLGPGGMLAKKLARYEQRPAQLALAEATEKALAQGTFLLAEAGTGVGKTLAYLVPALLSGQRVVISTATRNLQEQIFFKDLPLLQKQLGLTFKAQYLKGRANYLCLHRFAQFSAQGTFADAEETKVWPKILEWADETSTGDRSELDLPDNFSAWPQLTSTSENCLGPKCAQYTNCFVTRARKRAEEANLVVVNHHLLFADLAIRTQSDGEGILPEYDAVVFDEAHALEDVATSFLGISASAAQVESLVDDALSALPAEDGRSGLLSALALKIRGVSDAFFLRVSRHLGSLREQRTLPPGALDGAVVEQSALVESLSALTAYVAAAEEPELLQLGRRSQQLATAVEFVCAAESKDHAYWVEPRGNLLSLKAAPVEVGGLLNKDFYPHLRTAVFTSATLTAGGGFDFCAQRLGIPQWQSFAAPSPFDFRRASALYLPTHLPEPNADGFLEAAVEELFALANLSQGRAFFLFTSLRNMEAAHGLLKNRLGWQTLLQGQAPKRALLESFVQTPSVLFASHSFWEGVDVPGPALSLVVMDRIPFASPSDPLVSARVRKLESRGENAFSRYQLPQAALRLRQGFGRLLRTQDDRGAVAVLDRRLSVKGYGRELLANLPPAARMKTFEELTRWWATQPMAESKSA